MWVLGLFKVVLRGFEDKSWGLLRSYFTFPLELSTSYQPTEP